MDVEKQNEFNEEQDEDVFVVAVPKEAPAKSKKKKIIACSVVIGFLVLVCVGIGVSKSSKSAPATISATDEFGVFEDIEARIPPGVTSIGCFRREESIDKRTLGRTNIIEGCSNDCLSPFFGIAGRTCACFVESLNQRLSLGSCSSVNNDAALPSERMEVFFKQDVSQSCSQDRTETVRNFLVEEDDAPFGFDIVENRFRSSPFRLFKDECGTNIYEVQTEVSEGSQQLDTTVEDIRSFAMSRRSERTASLETTAEASYKGLFFSAAIEVSASADQSQTNLFKSSGASQSTSRVFTSTGVKRLAEIKIDDFANRRHFITFSSAFGNVLRNYRDSGYSKRTAYGIINSYGQFVLTRGIFGGYMQLRTTMLGSDIATSFSSEQRAKECYEASVAAEARGFGFKAKGSVSGGECSEEELNQIRKSRSAYGSEVSEQTVVGGRRECSTCQEFTVEASDAALLTTKDKYPANDRDGVEFRLLSDFLAPEKVSPVEFRRLHINEREFADLQAHLQDHILDYINEIGESLNLCNCAADQLPYLDEDSVTGEQQCKCYSTISDISTELAIKKEKNFSKRGNRRSCAWDKCPSDGFHWTKDCACKNGINQCHLEGDPTTIERFDAATLTLTDQKGIWKMEASGRELMLGEASDTASGSACFDDPLRGGFRIDLSDTAYEFAAGSAVTVAGWSVKMRMIVDGTRLDDVSTHAAPGLEQVTIPPGTRVVEVICGGWGGHCTSELFVQVA